MPGYDYKCGTCGNVITRRSSIADRKIPEQTPCEKCGGHLEQQIGGCGVVPDAIRLGRKPVDEGFNEVLAKIHEQTPGSNLGDKLSRTPRRWTG